MKKNDVLSLLTQWAFYGFYCDIFPGINSEVFSLISDNIFMSEKNIDDGIFMSDRSLLSLQKIAAGLNASGDYSWLRGRDLNERPPGYLFK